VKLFNLFYTTILPHYENFIHFVIQGAIMKVDTNSGISDFYYNY